MKKNNLVQLITSLTIASQGFVSLGINSPVSLAQSQPILLAQNERHSKITEIGRLSTGERILQIPRKYMSRPAIREALKYPIRPMPNMKYTNDGEPMLYDSNQPRLFLLNGKKLTFVGYAIRSIAEFKVGNQTYWASLCEDSLYCSTIIVSKQNFIEQKNVKGFGNRFYILNIRKDSSQEGFFYVETSDGQDRASNKITYLVNLNLTTANRNQSVILCEVSRYTGSIRNTTSAIKNPDCQTGQQVMSK